MTWPALSFNLYVAEHYFIDSDPIDHIETSCLFFYLHSLRLLQLLPSCLYSGFGRRTALQMKLETRSSHCETLTFAKLNQQNLSHFFQWGMLLWVISRELHRVLLESNLRKRNSKIETFRMARNRQAVSQSNFTPLASRAQES